MTEDTERALRDLLADRAAVPQPAADPVGTLRTRQRRRSASRLGGSVALTGVAVLAIVVGPGLVDRDDSPPGRRTPPAAATGTAAVTSVQPSADAPAPVTTVRPTTVPGKTALDRARVFLEDNPEFRQATIGAGADAVVACAVVDRGVDRRAADVATAHFVWARCDIVSGDVNTAVSLPVRISYDGDGRVTGFLIPGDGAQHEEIVKRHFPRNTAAQPSAVEQQQLVAGIAARTPKSDPDDACSTPSASRVTGIYLASMRTLLRDDLQRGLKRLYVVDKHVAAITDDTITGVPDGDGPMPAAVRECLQEHTVHGLPITLVSGNDDPAIEREKADGFSPVVKAGVVTLSAVGAGDKVQVAASVGYGGGMDFHGGVFEVTNNDGVWTARGTGRMWIA
jgi:hypothetical protein